MRVYNGRVCVTRQNTRQTKTNDTVCSTILMPRPGDDKAIIPEDDTQGVAYGEEGGGGVVAAWL